MPRVSTTKKEKTLEKNKVNTRKGKEGVQRQTARKKAVSDKKTPAKKTAAKKTPVKKVTTKKTPAKKAVEKEEVEDWGAQDVVEVAKAATSKRKAPTVFASEVAKKRAIKTQVIVTAVLLCIGVGASAAVGLTDSTAGQIDVAQTIKDRNARMANMVDVDGPTVVAPVSNREGQADGGFIASPRQPAPAAPVAVVATSTASSTDLGDVGTSTESSAATEEQTGTADDVPTPSSNASVVSTATTTVTASDAEPSKQETTETAVDQNPQPDDAV